MNFVSKFRGKRRRPIQLRLHIGGNVTYSSSIENALNKAYRRLLIDVQLLLRKSCSWQISEPPAFLIGGLLGQPLQDSAIPLLAGDICRSVYRKMYREAQ